MVPCKDILRLNADDAERQTTQDLLSEVFLGEALHLDLISCVLHNCGTDGHFSEKSGSG